MRLDDFSNTQFLIERPGIFGLAASKLGGLAGDAIKGAVNKGVEAYNNQDSVQQEKAAAAFQNWCAEIKRQWIAFVHGTNSAVTPQAMMTFAAKRYHIQLSPSDMGLTSSDGDAPKAEETFEQMIARLDAVMKDPNATKEQKDAARAAKAEAVRKATDAQGKSGRRAESAQDGRDALVEWPWSQKRGPNDPKPEDTRKTMGGPQDPTQHPEPRAGQVQGINKSSFEKKGIQAIASQLLQDPVILDASKQFKPGTEKFSRYLAYLKGHSGQPQQGNAKGGGLKAPPEEKPISSALVDKILRQLDGKAEEIFRNVVQQARRDGMSPSQVQRLVAQDIQGDQAAATLAALICAYIQSAR